MRENLLYFVVFALLLAGSLGTFTTSALACVDTDSDGVCDEDDSDPQDPFVCRDVDADTCDDCSTGTADPWADGPDFDGDGLCDLGDADDDNDGLFDWEDPCPRDPSPLCDSVDTDGDGVPNVNDNCPVVPNPDQSDLDGDGLGDVCDPCPTDATNSCDCPDFDGDTVCDWMDSDPLNRFVCRDADADTCDDCASGTDAPDNDGPDFDGDGQCDPGDPDDDNDGLDDLEDPCPLDPLNVCVADDVDGDGIVDPLDNCPFVVNPDQLDSDGDGQGDVCDPCPEDPTDPCAPCAALPPHGESWWPGDGSATDLVGDNEPVGVLGAPVFVPAHVQEGIFFSGQDGYVVSNGSGLDCGSHESISILAWVRLDAFSPSGGGVLLDKRTVRGSSQIGYLLFAQNLDPYQAALVFRLADGSSSWEVRTRPFPLDEFRHVAVVLDRSADEVAIYLDGRRQQARVVPNIDLRNESDFYIGHPSTDADPDLAPFIGVIDELHFYGRSLSWCEVESIHRAGGLGVCRGDLDGDGIADYDDNCPLAENVDQSNLDQDLAGDVCDCGPSNYEGFRLPGNANRLLFGRGGARERIDWCPQHFEAGDNTVYTIARGVLNELPVGGGAAETCLRSALGVSNTEDSEVPPPGDAYWYLSRSNNYCGAGGYGRDSAGSRRGGPVLDFCAFSEQQVCLDTGGDWDPTSCGHWVCGQQPDCDAVIPGCICGPDKTYLPGLGCEVDLDCE